MDKEYAYLQPAYVLHQRPYRNTSVIVDVFSRDYGRLSLVAKGVKQKKSSLRSILQLFQLLEISWVRRSDLGTLTTAEYRQPLIGLNQEQIYPALYLNELLIRLVQTFNPMPELFDAYSDTLSGLSKNTSVPVVLRLFEKQILHSLGYEIPLGYDANTHKPIDANSCYSYIPEHGFIETLGEERNNVLFKGAHLIAFASNQIDDAEILMTAKRVMHINLKKLLGNKPLKSSELYKAFKSIK